MEAVFFCPSSSHHWWDLFVSLSAVCNKFKSGAVAEWVPG